MASDQLITAKHILDSLMDVQHRSLDRALEDLEQTEPDLLAYLLENLTTIQKDLVVLMGELATAAEDLPRYVKDGHSLVTPAMTFSLEKWITELEAAKATAKGWAMPGASTSSAALDFARTVCRRAERRACALQEASQLHNPEIIVYLNRLSDLLWVLARWVEAKQP